MILLLLALPAPAGAAGTQFVHVKFMDQARTVTLTIPTPACEHSSHATSCVWELFANEPDVPGQLVVRQWDIGTWSMPVAVATD